MYIILIALVLFILFYRKEDFTFYFKNLGESGGYLGGSTQSGFGLANDLSHVNPGSLSFLSGTVGSGGSGGSRGSRGSGELGGYVPEPVGTGLMGPTGHHVLV
jgi:hypothetical protein